jgi:MFS family permease
MTTAGGPHVAPGGTAVAERPKRRGFRPSTFNSLRHRDFRLIWFSTLFNSGGQWIQQVTLGWLVYEMTNSALLLGAINGVRAIPFLLVGPLAGVAIDRVNRQKLLVVVQVFMATLAALFAFDVMLGYVQTWHLFLFTFATGAGWAVSMPLRQSIVPSLVPREDLMNAIALNSAAFNLTRIIGPAIGGLLITVIGAGENFLIQAACYATVVLFVVPARIPTRARIGKAAPMLTDLVEGLKYVRHDKTVLTLILMAMVPMVFVMPASQTLLPVFSKDVLGREADGLGIMFSAMGVGALIGTLALASLGNFQRKGLLLLTGGLLVGVALILFSQSTQLPLSLAFLVAIGAFQMVYMSTNNTILHTVVRDDVRGRVMSIYLLDQGLVPLGSLLAGGLTEGLGPATAVTLMGATTVVLAAFGIAGLRDIRRLR